MRHSFFQIVDSRWIAVLDLIPTFGNEDTHSEGLYISRVNTPQHLRGQGHARSLMRTCLQEADDEGVHLYLWINAYGDMNTAQLGAWYERCGFTQREDGLFERAPQ